MAVLQHISYFALHHDMECSWTGCTSFHLLHWLNDPFLQYIFCMCHPTVVGDTAQKTPGGYCSIYNMHTLCQHLCGVNLAFPTPHQPCLTTLHCYAQPCPECAAFTLRAAPSTSAARSRLDHSSTWMLAWHSKSGSNPPLRGACTARSPKPPFLHQRNLQQQRP